MSNEGKKQNNKEGKEEESFSEKLKRYIKNLYDFSNYDTKTILFIILFIFLVGISLFLLYYMFFINKTFLYIIVVDWFVNPIILLGLLGIFLFLLIMAIQGLLVPIPSEIVLLSAGMIWGWFWGGILGIAGSMAAGMLCFYISKKGGRPLAEKFVGESALEMADEFIQKHGMTAIIIARSAPFLAFDPISYAAGLVDIDTKKYAIGTLIGSIPRAFFYAFLGAILISHKPGEPINLSDIPFDEVEKQAAFFNLILFVVLGVLVIVFVAYLLYSKHWEKKRQKE
ncbi:MAG: TVP38/TMEM64 family protein [Promethearchaeota archaeon]